MNGENLPAKCPMCGGERALVQTATSAFVTLVHRNGDCPGVLVDQSVYGNACFQQPGQPALPGTMLGTAP